MKKTFVSVEQQQKQQFLKEMQEKVEEHRDKSRICVNIRPGFRIVVSRNLYSERMEPHICKKVWVEFKPKSNLYDMYTAKEIEVLTQRHKLEPHRLRELIE